MKEFKNNDDIIIRKADKSNTFVIMDKQEYSKKIGDILSDCSKFKSIRKNPIDPIKKRINTLIDVINATSTPKPFFRKLEGHYDAGYIYGNPKLHKDTHNPPLRPIISQIGTPVYEVAKTINNLIVQYMPKEYVIDSTYEFIEICKSIRKPKHFASLDVESLFTNVPVAETIQIILENVYNHRSKQPPDIPRLILEELLLICTTQCPFRDHKGTLFVQQDGVSMGSPLGPTLASYYMCHIENNAFQNLSIKPAIYCRYVDDCFLMIDNIKELESLKSYFEEHSVLKFTYEVEINKKIPFLDIMVTRSPESLSTTVYRKPTNSNECLNYNSLCPNSYKNSVIRYFLHRAHAVTSSWELFHLEVQRIRQVLVNNNFPISIIDSQIQKFLDSKFDRGEARARTTDEVRLFYRGQFSSNYKNEERELKQAVRRNVAPTDGRKRLNIMIYYRNNKLRSLFICNKMFKSSTNDHVVYQYQCNQVGCNSSKYIGYTTMTLAKRFYTHVQTGAIRLHNKDRHDTKPLTAELLENTTVLYKAATKIDLTIAEAILIKEKQPILNQQDEGQIRVLRIF